MSKPRLIVNCAVNELQAFRQAAEAASVMSDRCDVRIVVSHLAAKNTGELTDPGDPYLHYSINFPSLFQFSVPGELQPFSDLPGVEANLSLMAQKIEVLRELGLKAAFFGREPVYFREPLYEKYPHWRGPRVDHPRRSRHPLYSLCLHQPEVQTLYRKAAEELCGQFPELDTFYWWSNDSGSGFCWYHRLYCGPNGPEECREQGPIPAIASFNEAIQTGCSAGGGGDPLSIMLHTFVWDDERMPRGVYRYPSDTAKGGAASVGADLSMTYPVRYVWDPLRRLSQFGELHAVEPAAVICWLSDIYHRSYPDPGTIRRYFKLWRAAVEHPAAAKRVNGRLALLTELARSEFGPDAADDAVDGWAKLREAFDWEANSPFQRPFLTYLPMYGPTSHRWLTRPFVAFPEELSGEEESYFLPHIFMLDDGTRRSNLLDLHGYSMSDSREDYQLRTNYFMLLASRFNAAGDHFGNAARKADDQGRRDLEAMALGCRLLACLWTTSNNWIEYAVLHSQGEEKPAEHLEQLGEAEREKVYAYRKRLERVFKNEMENMQTVRALLRDDGEGVFVSGAKTEEDPFTFGPNVVAQLEKKLGIMSARWDDLNRVYPR